MAVIRIVASIRTGFVDAINRLIRPDCQIAVSSHARVNDPFNRPCLPLIEAQPHRQELASVKLVCPHSGNAFTIRIGEENTGAVVRWTNAVADDAGSANRLEELIIEAWFGPVTDAVRADGDQAPMQC